MVQKMELLFFDRKLHVESSVFVWVLAKQMDLKTFQLTSILLFNLFY